MAALMRAAVLTVSSSLARGEGEDVSGPRLVELCEQARLETTHETVADDRNAIAAALQRLADEEGVRSFSPPAAPASPRTTSLPRPLAT